MCKGGSPFHPEHAIRMEKDTSRQGSNSGKADSRLKFKIKIQTQTYAVFVRDNPVLYVQDLSNCGVQYCTRTVRRLVKSCTEVQPIYI